MEKEEEEERKSAWEQTSGHSSFCLWNLIEFSSAREKKDAASRENLSAKLSLKEQEEQHRSEECTK